MRCKKGNWTVISVSVEVRDRLRKLKVKGGHQSLDNMLRDLLKMPVVHNPIGRPAAKK